ncbi:MAG TPA: sigma-70 family RNA polymerase sigma factor [Chitinophagaceae bacterium]|nr:sigma-70 family RNA polymerase sigma factor [Chitinophagaceae bacterium]HRX94185.1 sigma-70 family RNA polymerase sigma factor [Chitinophagaceae bacterium]
MNPENRENSLLEGLATRDRRAVETIYKENFNMVQALIINNNGSADDAKDIFQETMIVLFEKVRSSGFELNCQIKTFVYSVARRLWLKRLQQQNRYTAPGDSMESVVPVEEDLDAHDQRNAEFEMMEKAINNLGEPCKSLLEAYYLQNQSMQEIAASFGYTNADNAKNQKYKCLVRLKKIFFTHYKNGNSDG